jgi:hypothetical protein
MCGEDVLAVAVKCKHCGSRLDRLVARRRMWSFLRSPKTLIPLAAAVLISLAAIAAHRPILRAWARHKLQPELDAAFAACVEAAKENDHSAAQLIQLCSSMRRVMSDKLDKATYCAFADSCDDVQYWDITNHVRDALQRHEDTELLVIRLFCRTINLNTSWNDLPSLTTDDLKKLETECERRPPAGSK